MSGIQVCDTHKFLLLIVNSICMMFLLFNRDLVKKEQWKSYFLACWEGRRYRNGTSASCWSKCTRGGVGRTRGSFHPSQTITSKDKPDGGDGGKTWFRQWLKNWAPRSTRRDDPHEASGVSSQTTYRGQPQCLGIFEKDRHQVLTARAF